LQAEKNVFVVFYSGERAKSKILKICEAFGANRYPFSEDLGRQAQMITEVCIIILVHVLSGRCSKYLLLFVVIDPYFPGYFFFVHGFLLT